MSSNVYNPQTMPLVYSHTRSFLLLSFVLSSAGALAQDEDLITDLSKVYIQPHFAAGPSYTFLLTLMNLGDEQDTGTITVVSSAGDVIDTMPYTVEQSQVTLRSRGFGISTLETGYLLIESTATNSRLGVSLQINYVAGGVERILSVRKADFSSRFMMTGETEEGGGGTRTVFTGIAVANPNNVTTRIRIERIRRHVPQERLPTLEFELEPFTQRAVFLHELELSVQAFFGTVIIYATDAATGKPVLVSILGLRQESRNLANMIVVPEAVHPDIAEYTSGFVTDIFGRPLIGKEVTFTEDGTELFGLTNSRGHYRIDIK